MTETRQKHSAIRFAGLLILGFCGLCLPTFLQLRQGTGFFTAVWILAFLLLTDRFRERRERWITFGVFLIGYCLRYLSTVSFELIYAPVFLVIGLILYGIFRGYALLLRKWNRPAVTPAFPALWLATYLLATLGRFPSLIRVDMMFADMNVLLQSESLLSSFGLSFALLWILSLLAWAVANRKTAPAFLGAALYVALLMIGTVYLYPNVTDANTVRVALSTGPYSGDYLDFTPLSTEEYLDSMRSCVARAAEQGAEIIAFNEETYEIDDAEEESFLAECCRAAGENRIHMLVGLDLRDTDGSEDGKSQNKVVWIDQNGEILGSYLKVMTIPILESGYVRGSGEIPSHVITVGGREIRVSYLICYDSNFPLFAGNIARGTDILFLPGTGPP